MKATTARFAAILDLETDTYKGHWSKCKIDAN